MRRKLTPDELAAKFDSLYTPEPNTGCWLWLAGCTSAGYPELYDGVQVIMAHRYAFERFHRKLRPGEHVRHRCDFPPCVSPYHHLPGNARDNAMDRIARGRQLRGAAIGNSRLTDADVLEMRRLRAAGWLEPDLAARFHISKAQTHRILVGERWRHLPGALPSPHGLRGRHARRRVVRAAE